MAERGETGVLQELSSDLLVYVYSRTYTRLPGQFKQTVTSKCARTSTEISSTRYIVECSCQLVLMWLWLGTVKNSSGR